MRVVLVVDDNESLAAALAVAVGRIQDVEAVVKYDPFAALQFLSSDSGNTIAAIITDFNLPRLNGLEFIREVRTIQCYRTLPAILVTAEDSQADVNGDFLGRPNAVFRKPFSMREVCRALEQLLA